MELHNFISSAQNKFPAKLFLREPFECGKMYFLRTFYDYPNNSFVIRTKSSNVRRWIRSNIRASYCRGSIQQNRYDFHAKFLIYLVERVKNDILVKNWENCLIHRINIFNFNATEAWKMDIKIIVFNRKIIKFANLVFSQIFSESVLLNNHYKQNLSDFKIFMKYSINVIAN